MGTGSQTLLVKLFFSQQQCGLGDHPQLACDWYVSVKELEVPSLSSTSLLTPLILSVSVYKPSAF